MRFSHYESREKVPNFPETTKKKYLTCRIYILILSFLYNPPNNFLKNIYKMYQKLLLLKSVFPFLRLLGLFEIQMKNLKAIVYCM